MTELFEAVSARLRAIFTAQAALELETEMILAHVERKAELLRRADALEKEGLGDLAVELREHAGRLDPRRPAEAVLPALPAPVKGVDVAPVISEAIHQGNGGCAGQA